MSRDWDASTYDARHAFVWKRGADLLPLLGPQPGERILDLGCGTGHLTAQIADFGAAIVGLDSSPAMVEQARERYPALEFLVGDAADFSFPEPFDAIFSNAALHWVKRAEAVIECVRESLRPGGRLVAEFGGKDNIREVMAALTAAWPAAASEPVQDRNPWYYPSLGDYATLLERRGFRVTFGAHFDRPTPLAEGEEALEAWLRQFAGSFLDAIPVASQAEFLAEVVERLRPALYRDGRWTVDYVRLRIAAVRREDAG